MNEENEMPKVLVGCPTYDGKEYVLREYMENITNLDYPNYDVILVDNSERKGGPFFKRLNKYPKGNAKEMFVLKTNRCKTSRESIAKSRNIIKEHFHKGGYDYFMSIEFDLIPPKTIIQELMAEKKPVITAMYEIGYEDKASHLVDAGKYPLIHMAVREGSKTNEQSTIMTVNCPHCDKAVFIKNRTRQLNREEMSKFIDGTVKQVHGCGVGCTLITKEIMEFLRGFRVDTQYNYHDDTFFYLDLWNNHKPVYLHTGYNIKHANSDWQAVKDF